jgi:hypothetical protein
MGQEVPWNKTSFEHIYSWGSVNCEADDWVLGLYALCKHRLYDFTGDGLAAPPYLPYLIPASYEGDGSSLVQKFFEANKWVFRHGSEYVVCSGSFALTMSFANPNDLTMSLNDWSIWILGLQLIIFAFLLSWGSMNFNFFRTRRGEPRWICRCQDSSRLSR